MTRLVLARVVGGIGRPPRCGPGVLLAMNDWDWLALVFYCTIREWVSMGFDSRFKYDLTDTDTCPSRSALHVSAYLWPGVFCCMALVLSVPRILVSLVDQSFGDLACVNQCNNVSLLVVSLCYRHPMLRRGTRFFFASVMLDPDWSPYLIRLLGIVPYEISVPLSTLQCPCALPVRLVSRCPPPWSRAWYWGVRVVNFQMLPVARCSNM